MLWLYLTASHYKYISTEMYIECLKMTYCLQILSIKINKFKQDILKYNNK